jgi:hypothetical protein
MNLLTDPTLCYAAQPCDKLGLFSNVAVSEQEVQRAIQAT